MKKKLGPGRHNPLPNARRRNWAKRMSDVYEFFGIEPPRKKSTKPVKPATVLQEKTRSKFAYANALAGKMNEAAKIGYHLVTKKKPQTPMNCLMTNIMNCTVTDGSQFVTSFKDLLLSEGTRNPLMVPQIRISILGNASLTWIMGDRPMTKDSETDLVYLLIYSETQNAVLYSGYVGLQKEEQATIDIGPIRSDEVLHCWNFLKAFKGYEVSYSDYIKDVKIIASEN